MNYNNSFNYDGCYKKPTTIPDPSFLTHLSNNFYKSSVKSARECGTQALRNNSDFFLINDIYINNNLSDPLTNCYIPKIDNTNQSLFGTNSVITKSKQLFDGLFKTTITSAPYIKQDEIPDICNTLMYNKDRTNKLCFKYDVDNQYYTPRNFYAYYTKPILNTANIALLNINSPEYYEEQLTSLKDYEKLLRINDTDFDDSGPLVNSFSKFVCDNLATSEADLNIQINKLKDEYDKFDKALHDIKMDLSSINYLNSFDDDVLKEINLNIANKKQELNSLLGSGGANNGRLDDTTLLTQFKIVENSILLLLIVSAIFFFTKSKKTILAS